jgi:hypothetical protein
MQEEFQLALPKRAKPSLVSVSHKSQDARLPVLRKTYH